jgi:hypothetical protein
MRYGLDQTVQDELLCRAMSGLPVGPDYLQEDIHQYHGDVAEGYDM